MMSEVIQQETIVFLLSVLHGAGLTFCYDLLRALRRAVPHRLAAVSAEDFLFWLAAGFLTFCLAFLHTDGVIRGYVAVGIALGVILYHFSASNLVVRFFSWSFLQIRHLICVILRILWWPVKKICQFWQKIIEIIGKSGYNVFINKIRGNCHGQNKKKTKQ